MVDETGAMLRLEVGPVDLARRVVRREDQDASLTTKEAELLTYVAQRPGRDIPREELLSEVWGYGQHVVSRTADTTMQRLRAKIERDPAHPRHLITVHGVGYRFEALGAAAPPSAPALDDVLSVGNQPSPTNIRPEPGRFIGREEQRAFIRARLSGPARMLTLVGPGGAGKTRLAKEAALDLADAGQFPGGIWFCDLTEARTTADVLRCVGAALDVPLGEGKGLRDPVERIGRDLQGRGLTLLVHDNAEQVVEEGAPLLARWEKGLPNVRWLITSRERLRIAPEEVLDIEPLPVDQACELFLERAAHARPGLTVDEHVQADVRAIVAKLDGLPLAIELVAPRVAVLTPSQIRERLESRFQLASTTRRDLPVRQRTLRAALDWSWDLLSEAERATLAQVAVFRGGFRAAVGEQVVSLAGIADAPWIPDVLQALLDKSLLRSFEPAELPGETRITLLESIREYAAMRLDERDDRAEVQARHARVILELADSIAKDLDGDDLSALRRLGLETENLRVLLERNPSPEHACRAAILLEAVLSVRGPIAEHRALLDRALVLAEHASQGLRLQLLLARARARRRAGEHEAALEDANSAMEVGTELGDAPLAEAIFCKAMALDFAGHPGRAAPLYADAKRRFDAVGLESGQVRALAMHAFALWQLGRRDEAEPMLRDALQRIDATQLWAYGARMLSTLGLVLGARGRWEEALEVLRGSTFDSAQLGSRRGESLVLANLGALASAFGAIDRAVTHAEEALALQPEGSDPMLRAVILRNLGLLEADRGDHGEAHEHLSRALAAHTELRDDLGCARVWTDLGELAMLTGNLDAAAEAYVKAGAAAADAGDRRQIAIVTACDAVLLHVRGDMDQAAQAISSALLELDAVAGPRIRGVLFALAGAMAADRDRVDVAERLLDQATGLLDPLGDRNGRGVLRLSKAVLQLAQARATTGTEAAILRERAARAVAALSADHAAHEVAVPRLLYENARRR